MTILILHPEGLSDIDLLPASGADPTVEDYVVNLATLTLNEEKRLEIALSEGPRMDGGDLSSYHGPLVEVSFRVVVHGVGATAAAARASLIQRVHALRQAVTNPDGGTLEYKPDDLDASVRSTYYHYLMSPVPRLARASGNNWDAAPVQTCPNYVYALNVDVTLNTQPYATSDPDNPVSLTLNRTILHNGYDPSAGRYNYFTVASSEIGGDSPALCQLRIRNLQTGASEAIGTLWLARRTAGLDQFVSIYDARDAADVSTGAVWSDVSDASRNRGYYKRASFGSGWNGVAQALRFTIANEAYHRGRMALAIVARVNDADRANWTIDAQYRAGEVIQSITPGVNYLSGTGTFMVFIIGEVEMPPTEVSDSESIAAYIDVRVTRAAGDSTTDNSSFDIDFLMLLPVDEHVLQIDCGSEGVDNNEKLLLESFSGEVCHIVSQDTLQFLRLATPLGTDFLTLDPRFTNRVDLLWERIGGSTLLDDEGFDGYEDYNWMPVFAFDEVMTNASRETDDFVEWNSADQDGVNANSLYPDLTAYKQFTTPKPKDVTGGGMFTTSDFLCIALSNPLLIDIDVDVYLDTVYNSAYARFDFNGVPYRGQYGGFVPQSMKLSDAVDNGVNWSSISAIRVSWSTPTPSVTSPPTGTGGISGVAMIWSGANLIPWTNATVYLLSGDKSTVYASTTSDAANGTYSFSNLAAGTYHVFVLDTYDGNTHYGHVYGVVVSAGATTTNVDPTAARPRLLVDDLRISKADPDDATTFNETGDDWDFPSGHWHIEEQGGATKRLAQIDAENGVEKVALYATQPTDDVEIKARVKALEHYTQTTGSEGELGIVFRCSDGTPGAENMYALMLATGANQVRLVKWVSGSRLNVAAPVNMTVDLNTEYWLGVRVSGSTISGFVSDAEDDLFSIGSRVFHVTDTTHSSGYAGLISIADSGCDLKPRFTDVTITNLAGEHVPSDQIGVELRALYRTIFPFRE